jgi:hypothetical protein
MLFLLSESWVLSGTLAGLFGKLLFFFRPRFCILSQCLGILAEDFENFFSEESGVYIDKPMSTLFR